MAAKKHSYVVLDGAGPEVAGRAVQVGDTIRLTEAEALYEFDMGRIGLPEREAGMEDPEVPAGAE